MKSKLTTNKKVFLSLILRCLTGTEQSISNPKALSREIYDCIKEEIDKRLIIEVVKDSKKHVPRQRSICETLRHAYIASDMEEVRKLIAEAYNYGQKMSDKLIYYKNKEDDSNVGEETLL